MRANYGSYIVAIICFIIAGLVLSDATPYLPKPATFEATAMTVIFAALGLISTILGYALRPKPIVLIPETKETLPLSPPPVLPPTEEITAIPPSEAISPTTPREDNAKTERKKPRTRRKRARRKKA